MNYQHVGFLATVVNQEEAERDVEKLTDVRSWGARWVGLSIEPQLGDIDLIKVPSAIQLDWIITGGESKQGHDHEPRPYNIRWANRLIQFGEEFSVPVFVKQLGDNPIRTSALSGEDPVTKDGRALRNAGGDMAEWPPLLRVRQMPRVYDAQG